MTITVVNVDKNGILGTRVYASVSDLPTQPNVGQFACVDDGTTATYYRSVEGYPNPVWELWNATGPTGPTGPIPIFGAPFATELSPTSAPTVELTGTGTALDPVIMELGIPQGYTGATGPAGPTGPTGPTGPAGSDGLLSNPPLPSIGAPSIDFWYPVLTGNQALPWTIPNGYTVEFLGHYGQWTLENAVGQQTTCNAIGTTDTFTIGPYTYFRGKMYALAMANGDAFATPYLDLEAAAYVNSSGSDKQLILFCGRDESLDTTFGQLYVELRVTPPLGDVLISYTYGSGPSYCNFGDTITVTGEINDTCSGKWGFANWSVFSVPVKLTVVHTSVWDGSGCDPSNTLFGWSTSGHISSVNPNLLPYVYYPYQSAPDGSVIDPCTEYFIEEFGYSASPIGTIQLKIEAP